MDAQIKMSTGSSQFEIKINYLQEENKLLKERIQDLEEIIKLNKKAFERSVTLESRNKTDLTKTKRASSNSLEDQLKFLKSVTEELTKENSYLNLKIEKLMKERDLAKDKALVSEQVANEFKRQERETTNDYKAELVTLKKKLEDREKKIREIQTGGIFRIKNVVSPEEKSMYFHSEIEGYRNVLSKALKKLALLKTEKEELIKLNQQFFNEIIKSKELLSLQNQSSNSQVLNMLVSTHQNTNTFTATNQALNLLEFHKKFYNLENDNLSSLDEISPLHSPLPCRVEVINGSNSKSYDIPKLDINKAILIQEMTINEKNKKNGSELPQREVVQQASNNAEKIKKMESELKRTKKLLQNEMLENQMLKTQMCKLDEENVGLRSKNKLLVEAQKSFEVKWKKINNLLTIYKHYGSRAGPRPNFTSINNKAQGLSHNRNKSENNYNFLCVNLPSANKFSIDSLGISNYNDLLSTDELNPNRDLELIETRIREQLMTDKESRRVVNLSLIDSEDCKNDDFSERAQYIKFLQNMGSYLNELYKNTNQLPVKKRNFRSNSLVLKPNALPPNTNLINPLRNKKPSQIFNDGNKYLSLRYDFKDTVNRFKSKDFNVPNPRLDRNLISPISKPNYNERGGLSFGSAIRPNFTNNNSNTPVHLSIGNLGSEEVFC